jgi:hypothetical protein
MKRFLLIISVTALFIGCATSPSSAGKQTDLFTAASIKSLANYSIWMNGIPGQYFICYYSDTNNFNKINRYQDANASGKKIVLYYKNKTGMKMLKSIMMSGYFVGNPSKEFRLTVQSRNGENLFDSGLLKYSEFPEAGQEAIFTECPVNLRNAPKEFLIILETFSDEKDALFIRNIPSQTDVYTFVMENRKTYQRYNRKNAAIFPKFLPENASVER